MQDGEPGLAGHANAVDGKPGLAGHVNDVDRKPGLAGHANVGDAAPSDPAKAPSGEDALLLEVQHTVLISKPDHSLPFTSSFVYNTGEPNLRA